MGLTLLSLKRDRDAAWERFFALCEADHQGPAVRYHMYLWLALDDAVKAVGASQKEVVTCAPTLSNTPRLGLRLVRSEGLREITRLGQEMGDYD